MMYTAHGMFSVRGGKGKIDSWNEDGTFKSCSFESTCPWKIEFDLKNHFDNEVDRMILSCSDGCAPSVHEVTDWLQWVIEHVVEPDGAFASGKVRFKNNESDEFIDVTIENNMINIEEKSEESELRQFIYNTKGVIIYSDETLRSIWDYISKMHDAETLARDTTEYNINLAETF